jgi:hypothetical protein
VTVLSLSQIYLSVLQNDFEKIFPKIEKNSQHSNLLCNNLSAPIKNLIINFSIESCAEIPCKLSYLFFSASNKQKESKEMKKLYLKNGKLCKINKRKRKNSIDNVKG